MVISLTTIFRRIGLPKHAEAIYHALDTGGMMTAMEIERSTKLHRPALFKALRALLTLRLIDKIPRGKRFVYSANERDRILSLFSEEENKVAAISHKSQNGVRIEHFEGESAVTQIFNDVLEHTKRGDTFYRYTSERNLDEVNALLPKDYRARRDAKKLERMVISNPDSGKRKKSRLERFVKFLDGKDEFKHNVIQLLYGSRIALIDLSAQRGFIIESAPLAEFQKTIFKALYRRL